MTESKAADKYPQQLNDLPNDAGCGLSRRVWLFRTVFHVAADNLRLVMDNTLPPSMAPVTGRQQLFESGRPSLLSCCALCATTLVIIAPVLQHA